MNGLDHRLFLQHEFALVDPQQVSDSSILQLPLHPLVPDGLSRHARLMPRLVQLGELRESEKLALLDRACTWYEAEGTPLFAALLSTNVSPELMERHWRRVMIQGPSSRRVWVRLHDPGVFCHLRWIISQEKLAYCMGPIKLWTSLDPWSSIWSSTRLPAVPRAELRPLCQEDIDSISLVGAMNIGAKCLARNERLALNQDDAPKLYELARAAQAAGLADLEDVAYFIRLAFVYGLDFLSWKETVATLSITSSGTMSFVGACSEYDRLRV